MRIFETPEKIIEWRLSLGAKSVGFVPTMGALHAGHESLLKKARAENEICVLSIFVNPTQFNDPNDFSNYPKTWDTDLKIAVANGVDAIFAPNRELMYPDQYRYKITEADCSKLLCGGDRPGHFDGVLTVVMKLFNLVNPTHAYFGEKDFQQLSLIRGMVEAYFMPVIIVPVATVREKNGLAMSSRNARLSTADRDRAAQIYQALIRSASDQEARVTLENKGFQVDYVIDRDQRRFAAVRIGEVRLIDNVELK